MNLLRRALRILLQLFVDDGKLAVEILLLLGCTAFIAGVPGAPSWIAMAVLVGGTLAVLIANLARTARRP